jgi:hypothetical protein
MPPRKSSHKGNKSHRSSMGCRRDNDDVTTSLLEKSYNPNRSGGGGVGARPFGGLAGNVSFFSFSNLVYWFIAVLPLVIGAVSLGMTVVYHNNVDDDVDHLNARVATIDISAAVDIVPKLDLLATTCLSPNLYVFDSVSSFYVV